MARLAIRGPQGGAFAGETLTLTAWNLGYAGLGAGSDFTADGGTHTFPPSRAAVRANLAGILAGLDALDADVFILPEVAKAGPVTYWTDLHGALERRFAERQRVFHPDFVTHALPWPLRIEHGLGVYARVRLGGAETVPLPLEGARLGGLVRRAYALTIVRAPMADGRPDWIVMGVHLAAFDAGGAIRKRQLAEALACAQAFHAAGHPVVLGGDFNLVLAPTAFAHTTEEKYLFWIHDFPHAALPEGWRIGCDPSVGSVRTNERPYRRGENYTCVIDGFVVSPNVAIEQVTATDLDFQHADHQPVTLRARRTG